MADMIINGDVVLKKNNATDAQGVAIPPTLSSLNYGEIAINYNAKDACIFIKALGANNQEEIVKFVGENVIVRTLGEILGESAADLATLKEMIKLFEGSSSDVLTLVKNLQTEVGLKADSTYVNTELGKKLGKTETAADSSKLGGLTSGNYARFYGNQGTSAAYVDLNTYKQGFLGGYYLNNAPDPHKYTSVIATSDGQYRGMQLATSSTENNGTSTFELFVRNSHHKSGATAWNSWRKIMTDANCNLGTVNWNCKNLYATGSVNLTKDGKTTLQLITDSTGGGYLTLHDLTGARGAIIRGYAVDGIQAEFTKGGIRTIGAMLVNGAYADPTHKLIVSGSAKANYFRFGSQSGFDNVGYIGCGDPANSNIYLRANEDMTISAGGRTNDIVLYKDSTKMVDINRSVNLIGTLLIGNKAHGTSASPFYKDISFNGAYGTYAQIRMPEISGSSGEGSLEFWVRGSHGTSTTHLPERAIRINPTKNVQFYNNIEVRKSAIETRIIGENAGSLMAFEDVNYNNGNAVLCGLNNLGEAALWHRGNNNMIFGTKGVERMKITAAGNVGIGESSPKEKFVVMGGNAFIGGNFTIGNGLNYRANDKDGNAKRLMTLDVSNRVFMGGVDSGTSDVIIRHKGIDVFKMIGNNTASTFVLNNGSGTFSGNLVVKGEGGSYTLTGLAAAVPTSSVSRLSDLSDVDLTGASEGYVLYQSTDVNANGDRIWKAKTSEKTWDDIHGKPMAFKPLDHNHIGSTYVTTPSDRALKTDIVRIVSATNTILSLTPYTYNWTAQAMEVFGFKSHSSAGVIAQEIENIIPSAVTPLNGEFMSVDYIQIIPYLIGAFQELHAALQSKNIAIANAAKEYKRAFGANEKLAKRVTELEAELNTIKNQIAA